MSQKNIKERVNDLYDIIKDYPEEDMVMSHIASLEFSLRRCNWELKDTGMDRYWEAKCGADFFVMEEGLKENNFVFCPSCGGVIKDITP